MTTNMDASSPNTFPPSCHGDTTLTKPDDTFAPDLTSLIDVINYPSCILITLTPIQFLNCLLFQRKQKQTHSRPFRFANLPIIFTLFLIILTLCKPSDSSNLIIRIMDQMSLKEFYFTSAKNQIVPYVFVIFIIFLEKFVNLKMTIPLFLFWSASFTSLSLHLYEGEEDLSSSSMAEARFIFLTDVIITSIVFLQCLLLFVKGWSKDGCEKIEAETWIHPQDESSWFGDFTLQWTSKCVETASKRTLLDSDAYDLAKRDQCRFASAKFEQILRSEEAKKKGFNCGKTCLDETRHLDNETASEMKMDKKEKTGIKRISLLKILIKTFGFKLFVFQFMEGIAEFMDFVTPVLMGVFMSHIQNRDKEHWSKGAACILGIFLINGFRHIFHRRIWAATCRLFKQVRNSISICVFKKSLTVRSEFTKDLTTGEIVNLISDDIDKVYDVSQELFRIFSAPITIGISMYLLYNLVGYAVFVGLLVMVLLIPLNEYSGKSVEKFCKGKDKTKHRRIKLMNEIINGIKLLKLYAWEPPFMQKVMEIRGKEEQYNNIISLLNAGLEGLFRAVPFLVKVSSFGVFLHFGGRLDAVTGFVTIHLFHILNDPVSSLTRLIPHYIEAGVSLKRIESFLNGDDIPTDIVEKKSESKSSVAISISNGEFTWERNRGTNTLKNIRVDAPKGSLIAVVGMIGSGKTSLLSAVLGEMEKIKGVVEVEGRIAYLPQEAWILNDTLQANILFGSALESEKYKRVIEACALDHDIGMMSARDKTEIGEKGINLSGGQKQRVSLARAVYNDADVYLFDDPLSAVDAHVGSHIFNEVISDKGLLRGKTRVLVTHGLHWLPHVDSIIVMNDGEIVERGTYSCLMSNDGAFSQLVKDVQRNISEKSNSRRLTKKQKNSKPIVTVDENQIREQEASDVKINSSKDRSEDESTVGCSNDHGDDDDDDNDDDNHDEDDDDDSGGDEDDSADLTDEMNDERMDEKGTLIKDEVLAEGKVKKDIYLEYLKAIGYKRVLAFITLYFITSLFEAYSTRLVKQWTDDPVLEEKSVISTDERAKINWEYFRWFSVLGALEVVGAFLYVLVTSRGTFNASTRLHDKLLFRIFRCPMSFFDTTPSSRIFTRFSKDVSRVDGLGGSLRELLCNFFDFFIFLGMIAIHCPSVSYYILALFVVYYFLYKYHIGSVRQLKRFISKYKPPILSHFTETLNGLSSIRSYECQDKFIIKMENHLDEFNKFDLMEMWCELVLNLRSGLLYHLVAMIAGLICLYDTTMTAGMVGLIVLYTQDASESMDDFCWNLTHTESEFVSLEKLIEYSNKPSEPKWEIEETKPSIEWPSKGSISIQNYTARYRDGLDLVLKGVNCDIMPGEKVGIVGRTGAGKTSLTLALFRILGPSDGSICIDGKDVYSLGLHNLRSRINILPQNPFIFSGTIKLNLDPFGQCSDESLWNALRRSHLSSFVNSLPKKLDFECGEGGKNLSAGQRQLLCLARALLRKTKVLILDEATAAVDVETDDLIQRTIRTEFNDCTVLSVAHRINTILDYDKILVMEQGHVREFDTPDKLLVDTNSIFQSMAKDARLL